MDAVMKVIGYIRYKYYFWNLRRWNRKWQAWADSFEDVL